MIERKLAVFDILTRPGPELTAHETESIKMVCKDLLPKLKTEKLVLAWRTKRTTRAAVRVEIEKKYPRQGASVYAMAG